MKIVIIEGMFYANPHHPELVEDHAVMKGVWSKCSSLIGSGTIMAPLLVDDRTQQGGLSWQTVSSLLFATTGREYESFPWLGSTINESKLEKKYKTSSCVTLYSKYHLRVIPLISFISKEWLWIKIHPASFKETNARALCGVWKSLNDQINFSNVASAYQKPRDDFRIKTRDSFLSCFKHYWVEKNGEIIDRTCPIWSKGKIIHQPIG